MVLVTVTEMIIRKQKGHTAAMRRSSPLSFLLHTTDVTEL